jgi:DNA processing protein
MGALAAGGRTLAVIGTGINRAYPAENRPLQERIAQTGAVFSQFWPDAPPARRHFPQRNVTMSGMTMASIVVEAGPTSGAKLQAEAALRHGHKVFLLPSLVEAQEWARAFSMKPNVRVVRDVEQVVQFVEEMMKNETDNLLALA